MRINLNNNIRGSIIGTKRKEDKCYLSLYINFGKTLKSTGRVTAKCEIKERTGHFFSEEEWELETQEFTQAYQKGPNYDFSFLSDCVNQGNNIIERMNAFVKAHGYYANQTELTSFSYTTKEASSEIELVAYLRKWLSNRLTKKQIKEPTYRKLNGYLRSIEKYELDKKLKLFAVNYNQSLVKKLGEYMVEMNPNYSIESAAKINKVLKHFGEYLIEEELISKRIKPPLKFIKKKSTDDKMSYVLDDEVIKYLLSYEPTSQALQSAKNFILISLYTGLRYGDVRGLSEKKVQVKFTGDNKDIPYIELFTSKGIPVKVALYLHPVLLKMYRENNGFPAVYSNQKTHVNLKLLFKQLPGQLDNKEYLEFTYAQGNIVRTEPLYKLVNCHTGRRSFYTALKRLDFNDGFVAKLVGHSTKDNSMDSHYNKITPANIAIKMHNKLKTDETRMMNPNSYWFN